MKEGKQDVLVRDMGAKTGSPPPHELTKKGGEGLLGDKRIHESQVPQQKDGGGGLVGGREPQQGPKPLMSLPGEVRRRRKEGRRAFLRS